MAINEYNFLFRIKSLQTGGDSVNTAGFLKSASNVNLAALLPGTNVTALTDSSGGTAAATIAVIGATYDQAEVANAVASLAAQVNNIINGIRGTADETNARVYKVEDDIDVIGNFVWKVPRDYDEKSDTAVLRILASQVAVSTDTDVELDLEMYVKTAGSALGANVAPAPPGTILSTTEQWVEFNLSGNNLVRDQVVTLELITNGANDTDGEEVLIHGIDLAYRSTLVSYDKLDGTTVLR